MGAAELGAILSVVAMLLLALLAFMGRKLDGQVDAHAVKLADLDKAIAVLNAAKAVERLEKLEGAFATILAELHFIRQKVEEK